MIKFRQVPHTEDGIDCFAEVLHDGHPVGWVAKRSDGTYVCDVHGARYGGMTKLDARQTCKELAMNGGRPLGLAVI